MYGVLFAGYLPRRVRQRFQADSGRYYVNSVLTVPLARAIGVSHQKPMRQLLRRSRAHSGETQVEPLLVAEYVKRSSPEHRPIEIGPDSVRDCRRGGVESRI